MPTLEFAANSVALPAWAVGATLALFVVVGVLALTRTGASLAGAILRVAVIVAAFAAVWLLLQQGAQRERWAERRALDARAADLAARAAAPGSPLGCLEALAGEAVETACEKQVFASPDSVAASVSYVSARLSLLADAVEFARRSGERYESQLATMRFALETDRFGLVAHVLSVRDSCTPLLCDSYALFKDPDRVQANLREGVFDHYVERYTAEWAAHPQPGVAAAAPGNTYTTASAPAAPVRVPSKYDFPSAASIPPISIMTAEPGMPPDPKMTAPAAAPATATATVPLPPTPPRRALHPPHPTARAATAAPQQIVPAPTIAAPGPSPH